MSYVDIPLSKFIGDGRDLIERLYSIPDQSMTEKKDDYEIIQNLPAIENYKPTRDHKPSVIWDKSLEGIFGADNVCIYDPYYILYIQLVNHISEKFDCDGEFKYCFNAGDDVVGCFQLTDKNDITDFLTNIIQNVPSTLFDVKENLGIN